MKKRFWKRITALVCAGIMTMSGISWSPVEVEAASSSANDQFVWSREISPSGYKKLPIKRAMADSNCDGSGLDGQADKMIDCNADTRYHSHYSTDISPSNNNNKIVFVLENPSIVKGITYLRRGNGNNGIWKKFKVYVSEQEAVSTQDSNVKWNLVCDQSGNEIFTSQQFSDRRDEEFIFESLQMNVKSIKIEVIDHVEKYITVAEIGAFGVDQSKRISVDKPVKARVCENGQETETPVNNDRKMEMMVDGIKHDTVNNYSDIGSDQSRKKIYVQIDLGDLYDISQMNLYRYWNDARQYYNTVIVIGQSETDFQNNRGTVVYNADQEGIHGFGAGEELYYNETSAGKEILSDVQGRYVRIYMNGSSVGNTIHIVEFEVYRKLDPADYQELNTSIALADNKFMNAGEKEEWYTPQSLENFKTALQSAKSVESNLKADQQSVIEMAKYNLDKAMENLEFKAVVPEAEPGYSTYDYTISTDTGISQKCKYNEFCTLPAPNDSTKGTFKGWKLGEDVVYIAKNPTDSYSFYVTGNYDFTAIYDETSQISRKAILKDIIITPVKDSQGYADVRFTAQIILPEEDKPNFYEAGLVWGIDDQGLNRRTAAKTCNKQYQFSITIKNVPKGMSIRGYIYAKLKGMTNENEIKSPERKVVVNATNA